MLQGRTEMEQRGKEGRGSAGKQSCRLSGSMIRLDQPSFPSPNPRIQYSAPTPAPPPHAHILPANATAPHSRIEQGHPIVHLLLCHLNGGRRVLLLPPLLLRHGCCWLRPRAAGAATEAVACHLLLLLAGLGIGRYGCLETALQQQSGGTWRASCKTWQALPAWLRPAPAARRQRRGGGSAGGPLQASSSGPQRVLSPCSAMLLPSRAADSRAGQGRRSLGCMWRSPEGGGAGDRLTGEGGCN